MRGLVAATVVDRTAGPAREIPERGSHTHCVTGDEPGAGEAGGLHLSDGSLALTPKSRLVTGRPDGFAGKRGTLCGRGRTRWAYTPSDPGSTTPHDRTRWKGSAALQARGAV